MLHTAYVTAEFKLAMRLWKVLLAGALLAGFMLLEWVPSPVIAPEPAQPRAKQLAQLVPNVKLPPVAAPSRAPISTYATARKPLEGVRICIDPGHGGQEKWDKILYTGGTRGVVTGQTESDVNLRVALILRHYLEAAGADVVMTRTTDDRCTNCGTKQDELDYRPNLANSTDSDLFISIHHNEANDPSTNYTLVFYPDGMASAAPLADNIASAVSRYLGTSCAGAKPGSYRILKKAKMPSALVEASFMSNPEEDYRLTSLAYNKLEAKAIATGILNYFRATRNMGIDFTSIFAPLDDQAEAAQLLADATIVRKKVVEKKSLFGRRYQEVTFDATGRVISRRDIGGGSRKQERKTRVVAQVSRSETSPTNKGTSIQAKPASTKTAKSGEKSVSASKPKSKSSTKSSPAKARTGKKVAKK
ncbi:MAG: N-acetylmuramoyl-L-alanine amidase [Candidatus Sumerlaeaceae bacterium]|nr:N-acetylmuramoyl-L-alanine amidase [Candidatus Sumerlaeaceae bacterium]